MLESKDWEMPKKMSIDLLYKSINATKPRKYKSVNVTKSKTCSKKTRQIKSAIETLGSCQK